MDYPKMPTAMCSGDSARHHDGPDWNVICAIEMVPTYADDVRIQQELTNWASPFGGQCDCWGSFGNRDA